MQPDQKNMFRPSRFFGIGISGQERVAAMVRAAITIFGVLAVIYLGTTYYLSQRVEAARQLGLLATTLQQYQTQMLQLRRNEKDFLDRKTTAELDKHAANYDKTLAVLARARANPEAASDDITVIDSLSKKTEDYRKAFLEAAKQQTLLGFDENSGLQGTLRKAVHELESVVQKMGDADAEVRVLTFRRHEKDFILRERDEYVKKFDTVMKEFKERLATGKFDAASQQRIGALLATYDTSFHDFVSGTFSVKTAVASARAAAQAAENPVAGFVAKGAERSAAAEDAAVRTLLISAAFLVVVLAGLSVLLVATMRAANATLAERILAQKKAEDENEMLNNSVISILQAVNQLSQRDLTARAPVTQDIIGTVSDSINALTDETCKVLHGVTMIAGLVESGSGRVKTQATLVSQTAEDERKSVNLMIGSLGDASDAMTQVAELAEQSNRSAEQATQATATALDTVNNTVKDMNSIRETIAETEKRIKRLGERSQEITGIVNLINTISERTHVLALNASMQAAVAGEAGRGFAVVAEEVQRLAESSRNATQQIGTLVNNIQLETNETISTVNRTIGQVVQGSEQAQKAGDQMRLTQEITARLVAQVARIAVASAHQKGVSVQLLESVQLIGESTERTAQQIGAQNTETETLLNSARRLVESVAVFKLPLAVA